MQNISVRTCCLTNKYMLEEVNLTYKKLKVPYGYTSDGLTKLFNKYQPRGLRGAILHDFNCERKIVSRKTGDKYALEVWKEDGVSWFKRKRWYLAIRTYAIVTGKK